MLLGTSLYILFSLYGISFHAGKEHSNTVQLYGTYSKRILFLTELNVWLGDYYICIFQWNHIMMK